MNHRTLTFKLRENEYEVKTPNIGQLQDIEEYKAQLTNGRYGDILRSRTVDSVQALDNVDMFANIYAFLPDVIKDMKVNSWKAMDPFDLIELTNAYKAQFIPWMSEFKTRLKEAQNPTPDKKTSE